MNSKERIREHILQEVHEKGDVKDDTLIFQQGYLDSMGFMVLIAFLDEAFGVKVTDKDMIEKNFESINAVAEFVDDKLA